jgi:hypothetical protein
MRTHAASPIPLPLGGDRVRVLISGRDEASRARIGGIELSLGGPYEVTVDPEPLADLGEPGTFDETGMVGGCAVEADGRSHVYYSGFQRGVTVPFWFFGGLLLSDDGARTARRASRAPVLDRSDVDPIIAGAPWILREHGIWRMWYTSGVRWSVEGAAPRHYYHIKYAESDDGLTWRRDGRVAIDFGPAEYAIGRPCVVRDSDCYRMWYSYRGDAYRIGYAESPDGLSWTRHDDRAGIDVSPGGWDSEMIEYAAVFNHAGRRWMLYNGNGYGGSGLGLAVLEDDGPASARVAVRHAAHLARAGPQHV